MARKCDVELYQSLKKILGREEAKSLVDQLNELAAQKARDESVSLEEGLILAREELKAKEERAAKIRKRNQYLNFIVRHNILKRLDLFKDDIQGMHSLLDGVASNTKESRYSTVSMQRSYSNKILSSMCGDIERSNLVHVYNNMELSEEIADEMFRPGSSSNKDIQKLAEIFHYYQGGLRKDLNHYGADIPDSGNYIAMQSHNRVHMLQLADTVKERLSLWKQFKKDPKKLREIAKQRWIDTILPLLDQSKTFQGADPIKFLNSAFDAMTSGIRLEAPLEEGAKKVYRTGYKPTTSNLASKISQERLLHFKDGRSWFQYNKIYGFGDMRTAILRGFVRGSEQLGLLKVWGPNPENMFADVLDIIKKRNRDKPTILNKTGRITNIFKEITGISSFAVNPKIANAARSFRKLQTLGKLGGVMISSLPDIATHASTLRFNGMGLFDSYYEAFSSLLKGRPKGEQKIIAELVGVSAEHILGATASRFMAEDSGIGTFSRLEQYFFRFNGMQWWDDVHRSSAAITLSRWLALNKNKSFEALDPKLQNTLRQYGIEDKEWSVISKSVTSTSDGRTFITPDKLPFLEKKEVADILGKDVRKVTNKDLDFVRKDTEDRLRNYFYDQIDHVILNARPSDRAIILGGSQAGTLGGEALRFIAQFKMYSIAFFRRVIMRELRSTFDGKSSLQGLTEIAVGSTLLGYISLAAHSIIDGKTPPDPSRYQTALQSLERGGGLGIMGDMLFGDFSQYGHGALSSLAGPAFGTLDQAMTVLAKARDLDDPRSSAFYLAKSNLPFLNLWYTKTALNYLFMWGIQERISPGYLHRMVRRVNKNNQHYFFNPVDSANTF